MSGGYKGNSVVYENSGSIGAGGSSGSSIFNSGLWHNLQYGYVAGGQTETLNNVNEMIVAWTRHAYVDCSLAAEDIASGRYLRTGIGEFGGINYTDTQDGVGLIAGYDYSAAIQVNQYGFEGVDLIPPKSIILSYNSL
jgi:hypothetical protein